MGNTTPGDIRRLYGHVKLLVLTFILVGIPVVFLCGCSRKENPGNHSAGHEDGSVSQKPNVIIFLVDSLRSDHLSCYGYCRETSPALDSFARDSVIFERAYSQASWTRPSVASLFTGNFPSHHHVIDSGDMLPENATTIARVFRDNGYFTAGVITNFNVPDRGFDYYRSLLPYADNQKPYKNARGLYKEVSVLLKETGKEPLFLYIHAMDPHYPYMPEDVVKGVFEEEGASYGGNAKLCRESGDIISYDREILYSDIYFGKLIRELEERGIYDNSIIIFMSDHGEEFGDHGGGGHGHSLFEELIHIPLVVKFPGGKGAGTRIGTPVRIIDVFPTLTEMVGFGRVANIDGASFLSIVDGGDSRYAPVLFAEERYEGNTLRSLIRDNFKFIKRTSPVKQNMLFDLSEDPVERQDISDREKLTGVSMENMLEKISSSLGAGYYFEIIRSGMPGVTQEISGRIRLTSGEFSKVETYETRNFDNFRTNAGNNEISFSFSMMNLVNPGLKPKYVVDARSLRFDITDPVAGLEISVTADGVPFPVENIELGAGQVGPSVVPFTVSVSDPAIEIRSGMRRALDEYPQNTTLRLYRINPPDVPREEPDEDTLRRMKSLNYMQ